MRYRIFAALLLLLSSQAKAETWTDAVLAAPVASAPQSTDQLALIQNGAAHRLSYGNFVPVQSYTFYIATTGNDSLDCKSALTACLTAQHVANLCPLGASCLVNVAPGTYHHGASVTYYKIVNFSGPLNGGGACINSTAVIFDDGGNAGENIWDGEDHVILVFNCLSVNSAQTGSIGFHTRQFAIMDLNDITFIQMAGGYDISAQEESKINVARPNFAGAAAAWARADDLSQITIGGVFTNNSPPVSQATVISNYRSIVNWGASSVVGGTPMGRSYTCAYGMIKSSSSVPGTTGAGTATSCDLP